MTNAETVAAFVETLLHAPEMTMQAVQMRLSMTDYELVLKKADPCKMHYDARDLVTDGVPSHLYQFPYQTGERSSAVL